MPDLWLIKGKAIYQAVAFTEERVWVVNADTRRLTLLYLDTGNVYAFATYSDALDFRDNAV
jgi:hypothetical protein